MNYDELEDIKIKSRIIICLSCIIKVSNDYQTKLMK